MKDKKILVEGEPFWASEIVRCVEVRPVRPDEEGRWKELVRKHHYLGLHHLVGETVLHVAEVDGRWVALLGWCSAALKVKARDHWIGWNPQQKQRRLKFVAQNGRFTVLCEAGEVPNLASRVLALSVRRLAEDWRRIHGHPVVLAETFVDGGRFPGTCYRAAGWTEVGETEGFGKQNMRYVEHGERKQVLVRPLFRGAEAWLKEPFDAPALAEQRSTVDLNDIALAGRDGLLAALGVCCKTGLSDGASRTGDLMDGIYGGLVVYWNAPLHCGPPPLGPNPAGGPRSDPLEVLFPVLYAEMGTLLPWQRTASRLRFTVAAVMSACNCVLARPKYRACLMPCSTNSAILCSTLGRCR